MSKEPKVKVKVISDLFASIAKLGLNFTQTQVEKRIDNAFVEEGVLLFLPPVRSVVEALNDNNPNNQEQVKDIVLQWVNEPLADFVEDLGEHLAARLKTDNQKAVAMFAVGNAAAMLRIFSDDEEDDKKQLQAHFDYMLSDPKFRKVLIDCILVPAIKRTGANQEFIEKVIIPAVTTALDAIDKD